MDPFTADFFSNLAAGLTGQVINGLGGALKRQIAGTPAELSLRRGLEAGVVAAVAQSTAQEPAESALLHDIFNDFFHDPLVGVQIARLLRGRSWDRAEIAELFAEAGYVAEQLPGLSLDAALDAFAGAFLEAADAEPELQGLIQIGQLRQQTGLQAALLAEMKKLVAAWQSGQATRVDNGVLLDAAGRPVYALNVGKIIGRDEIADADIVLSGDFRQSTIHIVNQYMSAPGAAMWTEDQVRNALKRYLQWVVDRYGSPELRGIEERERALPPITLDQVYVSLSVTPDADRQEHRATSRHANSPDKWEVDVDGRLEPVDMSDLLGLDTRHVITGAPGSGKTTYLYLIASLVARALLSGNTAQIERELGLIAPLPVPLFLSLGEYNQVRKTRDRSPDAWEGTLLGFAKRSLVKTHAGLLLPPDFLERMLMAEGSCLLLLDGLDEVVEESDREDISQEISDLSLNRSLAYVIVTSRTRAYTGGAKLPPQFRRSEVMPMSPEQVAKLAQRWCDAVYDSTEAPDETRQLQGEIERLEDHRRQRGEERRLADTPLLVTIIAIVYYNDEHLPEQRAALYKKCVQALIAEKHHVKGEAKRALAEWGGTEDDKRELLTELAYELMASGKKAGRQVSESQIKKWLRPLAVRRRESGAEQWLRDFLQAMTARASLLNERDRIFEFIHLSFQEFLCATHLATNQSIRDLVDFLVGSGHVTDSWWRETILLTPGYMGIESRPAALKLIRQLGDVPRPADAVALAAAELAATAYRELEVTDAPTRKLLTDRLALLLTDSALAAPNQLRGLAGVALGRLGDPRPDVACSVPDMVTIPAEPFRMGSDKAKDSPYYDDLAFDDEAPNHEIVLPDYRIGRYPVTVAQYRVFVDEAKGYDHETFWTPAGWGWRQANKITQPRLWDDPQWTVDNHPVVGVSWHEAVAYCNWLRAETGRSFRLPDEAMWEKAARGTDAGRWPWGSTWDATRLNVEGTIGRTSAVGIFPGGKSPYDIFDAAGNVWEWCSGPGVGETPYPFQQRPYAADLALDAKIRAVRGGSWLSNNQDTRAAYRNDDNPDTGDDFIGFRVAEHLSDPEF
jgi:formylglycine-generating enzyme required for sulfatase activity